MSRFKPALLAAALTLSGSLGALAGTYDITVDNIRIDTGEFTKKGVGYNKSQTPTVLRFKEGETVTLRVKNNLRQTTSIHWHGLILPFRQDGVPGISFSGIKPGQTFTYRFPIVQSGTYWFHSHSGFQEPDGAFGAIVIEPKGGEPIKAQRDYVIQLTDKHPHSGNRIFRNLKMSADYYNRSQRTFQDLVRDARADGLQATLKERGMWGRMRMMPTDIEDVQGFVPMMNGRSTRQNWWGLFQPGEKVRLRIINSSAMAYFDFRIPGLKMTVVQADGNPVKPVPVDELRVSVAETYDVIVEPRGNKPYSIIAKSMGRTALVRGTLTPKPGLAGPVPRLRRKPLLTMTDMGGMHGDMDMGGMGHVSSQGTMDHSQHQMPMEAEMDHSQHQMASEPAAQAAPAMDHSKMDHAKMTEAAPAPKEMDHSKMGHGTKAKGAMDHGKMDMGGMDHAMKPAEPGNFYAPGSGLKPVAYNGGKFLSYKDLRASRPLYRERLATRTIELRLTGNMERYIWSINGKKLENADPIRLKYGERVRFKFVNETMMSHPMHLHGMWTILDTGKGKWDPIKHTVSIAPGTTVYTETEVDAAGQWAFHCHLSYHAEAGMFRKIIVEGGPA
ncbi:copper resistance system multicopper oxidase [Roseovarius sp. C7]|uniref:copper resistance system multicopper oxidase n=1 Tax=Roseovarius sp. C7 TaxID=3398643 RepID=UPI0039F652B7